MAHDSDVTALERQQLGVVERATFWHRTRFALVARQIRRRGASTVVDLGAGSGMLGEWCERHTAGVEYRFAESSPALAEGLRRRFGGAAETHLGDAQPPNSVVAILDVLEHIDDDAAALRALRESLPTDATVVLTVPAHPRLFSQWDTSLGHFRRYTRRSLRAVLHQSGFQVQEISYLFPELLPLAVARLVRPATDGNADFPTLPVWVDRVGAVISGATTLVRRLWPAGTSLVAIASVGASR